MAGGRFGPAGPTAAAWPPPQPRARPPGPVPPRRQAGLGSAPLPRRVALCLVWRWVGLETPRKKADSKQLVLFNFSIYAVWTWFLKVLWNCIVFGCKVGYGANGGYFLLFNMDFV